VIQLCRKCESLEETGFSQNVSGSTEHRISEHCDVCNVILAPAVWKNDEMVTAQSLCGLPFPFVIVDSILGLRGTQCTMSLNSYMVCSGFHICHVKVVGGTL
jgi:hypothetical protein